jgi:hypothetical protein
MISSTPNSNEFFIAGISLLKGLLFQGFNVNRTLVANLSLDLCKRKVFCFQVISPLGRQRHGPARGEGKFKFRMGDSSQQT